MVLATTILLSLLNAIIGVFVTAFALWLAIEKILHYYLDYFVAGFRTALKVAGIAGIVSFILSLIPIIITAFAGNAVLNLIFFIINAAVLFYLIQRFYELKWKEAAIAWIIVLVISYVIGWVLGNTIRFFTIALI